jgi:isopentenyl diphosphate isomerase/L-lactate dehydrogenase-like FMN-dependent dehydrogenase
VTTDDGLPRSTPPLAIYADPESRFATIREVLACAQETIPADVWNYIEGGTSGEESLQINRAAFSRWGFRPRMLAGISRPDPSTSLLGLRLSMPVFISPFGNDGFIRPDGHLAVAEAVAAAGITNIVPEGASHSLEDIAERCGGRQGMVQMTLVGPDSHVLGMTERAAAAGYRAVCFTDAPVRAWRERLREARLDLMEQYGMANYGPGKADVAVLRELIAFTEPRWDWDRLAGLAARCPLPWFLKGILTPEDAQRAIDAGASGLYVSNYGGRELDGLPASLDQLPAIVDVAAGRIPVIMDSGIRRGTDVVKALALGASAVGIGRLAAFGLAADGAAGVRRVCELLKAEMETALGRLGCDQVAQLSRDCLLPALRWPAEQNTVMMSP